MFGWSPVWRECFCLLHHPENFLLFNACAFHGGKEQSAWASPSSSAVLFSSVAGRDADMGNSRKDAQEGSSGSAGGVLDNGDVWEQGGMLEGK